MKSKLKTFFKSIFCLLIFSFKLINAEVFKNPFFDENCPRTTRQILFENGMRNFVEGKAVAQKAAQKKMDEKEKDLSILAAKIIGQQTAKLKKEINQIKKDEVKERGESKATSENDTAE